MSRKDYVLIADGVVDAVLRDEEKGLFFWKEIRRTLDKVPNFDPWKFDDYTERRIQEFHREIQAP